MVEINGCCAGPDWRLVDLGLDSMSAPYAALALEAGVGRPAWSEDAAWVSDERVGLHRVVSRCAACGAVYFGNETPANHWAQPRPPLRAWGDSC